MHPFIIILLRSVACSGVLFAYYLLLLKNRKLHMYNRYYLLIATLISLTVPFVHFEWYSVAPSSSPAVVLLDAINYGDVIDPAPLTATPSISAEQIFGGIYLLVSTYLLLILIIRIQWVYRLKRKSVVQDRGGYNIIYTDAPQAPFSFLNELFWKKGLDMETEAGRQILRHELCHISQRHTLDKLFMQAVIIAAWANPFYWLIRKELALQHEFIADDAAIADQNTEAFARMILQSQYGNVHPDIIHPFFHSPIKRRLMMLTRSKNTKFSFLRRAMLLPVAGSVLFLLSFKMNKEVVPLVKAQNSISVVFDAGHGGMDPGGSGVNGVKEKELTLRICNRLMALAGEYHITAGLTRKDDSYPSLERRVELSDKYAPDVFVSIHMNKKMDGADLNPYEVIFSGKNKFQKESKALGSAITNRLNTLNIKPVFAQRGLKVVNENKRPALLIECGDIDNAGHVAMLTDDAKLEKFCRQILSGIADYGNSIK
jgi:N-acetylmuramoyl-L-alanine amidase